MFNTLCRCPLKNLLCLCIQVNLYDRVAFSFCHTAPLSKKPLPAIVGVKGEGRAVNSGGKPNLAGRAYCPHTADLRRQTYTQNHMNASLAITAVCYLYYSGCELNSRPVLGLLMAIPT